MMELKVMKYDIGERVRLARETLGLSQAVVAEKIGMTQQGYQDIEAGHVKSPRKIEKIASVLKTPKEHLLFGTPIYNLNTPLTFNRKIPIIRWQDVYKWNQIIESFKSKEPEEYVLNFNNYSDECIALRVQGDSMNYASSGQKSFKDGDIVIFDKDIKPTHGKYVIYTEKGSDIASFKQYIEDGARKYLKPSNIQYPLIPVTNKIEIRGVMVAHLDTNP
jgi:SOS-response transcriptional repressor LexA